MGAFLGPGLFLLHQCWCGLGLPGSTAFSLVIMPPHALGDFSLAPGGLQSGRVISLSCFSPSLPPVSHYSEAGSWIMDLVR